MSSTRVKSSFTINQDESTVNIDFNQPADYAMVDINPRHIFIQLRFDDKPYDEMITLSLNEDIDDKKSKSEYKKDGDKLVHLKLIKKDQSTTLTINNAHKFIEKPNHPKADPRGYSVKKPEKKNWDKIIANLDSDDDDADCDANSALKKIYDDCDDDTKRAMEKSLYESNGTVLNMNWADVGKGKVEPYKSIDEGGKFEGFGDEKRFKRSLN